MSRFSLAADHAQDQRDLAASKTDLAGMLGVDSPEDMSMQVTELWEQFRDQPPLLAVLEVFMFGMGVGRQLATFEWQEAKARP